MQFFIHVPSSGGTTLWSILRRATNNRSRRFQSGNIIANTSEARTLLKSKPQSLEIVGGHVPYGFATDLSVTGNYFTFLRPPRERIVSTFFRTVRNGGEPIPDDPDRALVDFARRNRSVAVHLLTGIPQHHIEKNYDIESFEKEVVDRTRSGFFFIGFTELFDESICQLARFLGWKRIPVYDVRNRGGNKLNIKLSTYEELHEILKLEVAIYKSARAAFAAQQQRLTSRQRFRGKAIRVRNLIYRRGRALVDPGYANRYVKK